MTQYFNHQLFILLLVPCQSRLELNNNCSKLAYVQFMDSKEEHSTYLPICSANNQQPKSAIMRYARTWPASNARLRHPRPNPHCLIPNFSSPTSHELGRLPIPCTLIDYHVPTFESLGPSARPMINQRSTNAYSCRPILIWIPLLPQLHTVGGSDRRRSSWSTSTAPANLHSHYPPCPTPHSIRPRPHLQVASPLQLATLLKLKLSSVSSSSR